VVAAGLVAGSVLAAQAQEKKTKPPKAPNAAYAKLVEPWPDADTLRQRKQDAETRPLFATDDPLVLTLTADFKAVNKDRLENSASVYAGTINAGAGAAAIPVEFSSRGHFRLRQGSCTWVPLRVHFKKKNAAGTLFDGQSSLKLVTHCRDNDDFEQHVLREYLPYRIYSLVSPIAFRARLAKITYADATGKAMTTRYGMFIEDDSDVARRAEARSIELPRTLFKDLEPESLTTMSLFEYMIGNTDVSIVKNHNVKLMVNEQRTITPVPYDFDFSGLVDTVYANPDPKLGIQSVHDRLYRGPCRSDVEMTPVVERFSAKKAEILALYDALPDLNAGYRKRAQSFLETFFSSIDRKDLKRAIASGCVHGGGM
jgi:hypothetical protein